MDCFHEQKNIKSKLKNIYLKQHKSFVNFFKLGYLVFENVLNRAFIENEYSKIWISDITYIQTKEGFLYLTIIMNLYDRKIIG